MKQMVIEIHGSREFASIIRAARAAEAVRTYGRLGAFGRSLITHDGVCFLYPAWTYHPPMNIQRPMVVR